MGQYLCGEGHHADDGPIDASQEVDQPLFAQGLTHVRLDSFHACSSKYFPRFG